MQLCLWWCLSAAAAPAAPFEDCTLAFQAGHEVLDCTQAVVVFQRLAKGPKPGDQFGAFLDGATQQSGTSLVGKVQAAEVDHSQYAAAFTLKVGRARIRMVAAIRPNPWSYDALTCSVVPRSASSEAVCTELLGAIFRDGVPSTVERTGATPSPVLLGEPVEAPGCEPHPVGVTGTVVGCPDGYLLVSGVQPKLPVGVAELVDAGLEDIVASGGALQRRGEGSCEVLGAHTTCAWAEVRTVPPPDSGLKGTVDGLLIGTRHRTDDGEHGLGCLISGPSAARACKTLLTKMPETDPPEAPTVPE